MILMDKRRFALAQPFAYNPGQRRIAIDLSGSIKKGQAK